MPQPNKSNDVLRLDAEHKTRKAAAYLRSDARYQQPPQAAASIQMADNLTNPHRVVASALTYGRLNCAPRETVQLERLRREVKHWARIAGEPHPPLLGEMTSISELRDLAKRARLRCRRDASARIYSAGAA